MLLFCLSVPFKRGLCERRMGDSCSTISSAVMAVIEPNPSVKRVRQQDASHLWIVEHRHDVYDHKWVLLHVAKILPGFIYLFIVKNNP